MSNTIKSIEELTIPARAPKGFQVRGGRSLAQMMKLFSAARKAADLAGRRNVKGKK